MAKTARKNKTSSSEGGEKKNGVVRKSGDRKNAASKSGARKTVTETALRALLAMQMRTFYDVETQLVKALPRMAKKASGADLKRELGGHERETKEHAERLERGFGMLELRPQKLQSKAIRGIIADAESIVKNMKGGAAIDAGLTAAAQYIAHYEIAGYESMVGLAKLIDQHDLADWLQDTLDEERAMSDELADFLAIGFDKNGGDEVGAEEAGDVSDADVNDEESEDEPEL